MRHLVLLVLAGVLTVPASSVSTSEPIRGDEPRSVSVAFTGDTLIYPAMSSRAARNGSPYDFRPMFADVRPVISTADLAICHLEVPLSKDNTGLAGYPLFAAPRHVADGLAYAGYDGCSTASNHSYDRSTSGVFETIEILADVGLSQSGMAVKPDEAWKATYYELDGLTLAHISATYWLNGLRMPEDQQWLVQLLDKDEILAIAARARVMGADVVVVSIHCCIEYQANPTEAQRQLNHDLIKSDDVDLVVGHHSHVVGPIERVGGEYIVHGLGNFLSAQNQFPALRDGVIAIANLEQRNGDWEVVGIDVVPTWVEPGTYRVLPAARANPASFERTMATVTSYGAPGIKEFQWTRTRLAPLR